LLLAVVAAAAIALFYWSNRPQPDYKIKPSGLYSVVVDGKAGFIDRTGALVIPASYDSAADFSEGLAAVESQKKFGYIDTQGTLKIPFQFDYAGPFMNGLAAVKLCCGREYNPNDQWGFIDKNGKYVINPQFSSVFIFNEGLAPVLTGAWWGYIDSKGKMAIASKFQHALPFMEGLAAVRESGRSGYIDKTGKFVINPQFEDATSFKEGLAAVRIGDKWGFIDRSGKYSVNPQFSKVYEFSDGTALVYVSDKPAIIDKNGNFLINPGQFVTMSNPIEGEIGVSTAEGGGLIDTKGNWLLAANPLLKNVNALGGGMAQALIANDWCFIDKSGAVLYGRFKGSSLSSITAGIESEKQAVATLRTLNTAQLAYASTYTTVGFADKLANLGPPSPGTAVSMEHAGLIDADLAGGNKAGYQFSLQAEPHDGMVSQYSITATPTNFSAGNVYCTDATSIVRFSKSGDTCATNSPAVPKNAP